MIPPAAQCSRVSESDRNMAKFNAEHDPPPLLAEAEVRAVAAAFAAHHTAKRNPFSISGAITWRGRSYHCKQGRRCLAAEAQALAQARELSDHAAVRVVPLAGYDAASNTLITHHVTGESLFNALWNGTDWRRIWLRDRTDWPGLMHALGAWLQQLHAQADHTHACGSTPPLSLDLLATINDRLETVRRHSAAAAGVDDALLDRIADLAADLAHDPVWQHQPQAMIHADLTLGNMLLDPGGAVTVLDFGYTRRGYAIEDVARLWCSLWELASCGRRRRAAVQPAMAALLEGYGLPGHVVDAPAFTLLRIWNAATRLNEAVCTRRGYRRRTAHLHEKLTACHVRWLTHELAADNLHRAA